MNTPTYNVCRKNQKIHNKHILVYLFVLTCIHTVHIIYNNGFSSSDANKRCELNFDVEDVQAVAVVCIRASHACHACHVFRIQQSDLFQSLLAKDGRINDANPVHFLVRCRQHSTRNTVSIYWVKSRTRYHCINNNPINFGFKEVRTVDTYNISLESLIYEEKLFEYKQPTLRAASIFAR